MSNEVSMSNANAQAENSRQRRPTGSARRAAARPVHFVIRQLHRGCWVVACEGRLIAGAVLSSLPAAAAYAGEIAQASGWSKVLLSVASSGRLA